jgi:hypothetical protein
VSAGLSNVTVYQRPTVLNNFGLLNSLAPFEETAHSAAELGKVDRDAVKAMLSDLHERDSLGRFFGCFSLFIAIGRRI